jgi:hypothetical protein
MQTISPFTNIFNDLINASTTSSSRNNRR